jgi:2-oxoglutarate dehydrogenase complex dehydrogenase (E1) component-like enzyme
MNNTSTPTVPVAADGLEGWTSCCDAAVTYSSALGEPVLVCKACYREVETIDLDDTSGAALSRIVTDVIEGTTTADEGVALQRALLAAGPLEDPRPVERGYF